MATTRKSEMEQVLVRLSQIETSLQKHQSLLENLDKRLTEVENCWVARDIEVKDKIKDVAEDCSSKITSSEERCEGRVEDVTTKLEEISRKSSLFDLRLGQIESLSKEWPTPQEASTIKQTKNSSEQNKRVRLADKFKDKTKDAIVLIGDSLARGVGEKLQQQTEIVTTMSRGGAKIENTTEQIASLQDNEDRHLVLLVGTNNIRNETSETVKLKYKGLLEASKKIKNRRVSVIGIPRRFDLPAYENSRRIGVNSYLEKLCKELDIEFILHEPYRSRVAKDGLHFNYIGQDELARKIFHHCMSFLV